MTAFLRLVFPCIHLAFTRFELIEIAVWSLNRIIPTGGGSTDEIGNTKLGPGWLQGHANGGIKLVNCHDSNYDPLPNGIYGSQVVTIP